MRVVDYRRYHSIIYSNRYSHVHVIVQVNSVCAPTGIQTRMLQQNAGYQGHEQVGVSDPNLMGRFDFFHDAIAILIKGAGIDMAAHKEMRNGRPALRSALGHDAAKRGRDFDTC